jgi:hypothetical protein
MTKKKPKRSIRWPGPTTKPLYEGNTRIIRDGEPRPLRLERFPNDVSLRGDVWIACCDCGLRHLNTFEVYKDPKGFCLVLRSWRDPTSGKES